MSRLLMGVWKRAMPWCPPACSRVRLQLLQARGPRPGRGQPPAPAAGHPRHCCHWRGGDCAQGARPGDPAGRAATRAGLRWGVCWRAGCPRMQCWEKHHAPVPAHLDLAALSHACPPIIYLPGTPRSLHAPSTWLCVLPYKPLPWLWPHTYLAAAVCSLAPQASPAWLWC